MPSSRDDRHITRREWLKAGLALGAAALTPSCVASHGVVDAAPKTTANIRSSEMRYDVIIVGGGPAGLQAALTLGRARKRVLLADAGPRRNAAAVHVHNFVTRDGTPPDEFRRVAREQLGAYPNVEVRDLNVESISGERGAFHVTLGEETVSARRVLLSTGMIDELSPLEGLRELWGSHVFQCPYCHGWEHRDRPWGYLARAGAEAHLLPFTLQLLGWTREVTLFIDGAVELSADARRSLEGAGVRIETRPLARLIEKERALQAVELADGASVPCEALFHHPLQRQTELVRTLGLALDAEGFVSVDPMKRETSIPGLFAAGDLTTRMQAAIAAATYGMQAASFINFELSLEDAASRAS